MSKLLERIESDAPEFSPKWEPGEGGKVYFGSGYWPNRVKSEGFVAYCYCTRADAWNATVLGGCEGITIIEKTIEDAIVFARDCGYKKLQLLDRDKTRALETWDTDA